MAKFGRLHFAHFISLLFDWSELHSFYVHVCRPSLLFLLPPSSPTVLVLIPPYPPQLSSFSMSEVPETPPPPSEGNRYDSLEPGEVPLMKNWERTPPKGGIFDTPRADVEVELTNDDTTSVKSKRSSGLKISFPAAAVKSALGFGKKVPKLSGPLHPGLLEPG